jgi:hypothetical protein|tara:strand:+ start:1663 stop:1926 length:264 start_codon:yes stop_codon:yes gene_type:complete
MIITLSIINLLLSLAIIGMLTVIIRRKGREGVENALERVEFLERVFDTIIKQNSRLETVASRLTTVIMSTIDEDEETKAQLTENILG